MHQPPTITDREFFAPLHGLRGIAVLYVVVSHLGLNGLFLLPLPHDAVGKVGVWIFFSLSAFLLTTHLYRDLATTPAKVTAIARYAIHRVFRIYPLYLFTLIIHLLVGHISLAELLRHLLLLEGRYELWAIPVEFQYYLVMPVIALCALWLAPRHLWLLLLATLSAVCYYGISHPAEVFSNELNLFPKLAPFLLGSMVALLHCTKQRLPGREGIGAWGLSLVSLAGLVATTVLYRILSRNGLPTAVTPWLSLVLGGSVAGLIHAATQPNLLSTILGARPLVFIGEISFSVYLLHIFVIRLVQKAGGLPPVIAAWLTLGLCLLLSALSYRAIERPGIRAGKILGQKLRIGCHTERS